MSGPRAPHFVIVGTPRSGTTLVQRLACELPGVVVPPETHVLSLLAPELLRAGFPLARERLASELRRYVELEPVRELGLDSEQILGFVEDPCPDPFAVYAAVLGVLGGDAPILGEKTPDHLRWWRPLSVAYPALRFVAVVRDPRGVVASNLAVPWGMNRPATLAERWMLDQRELRAARGVLGDRFLLLRYEDVVNDPARSKSQLAALLGITAEADAGEEHPHLRMSTAREHWKRGATGPVSAEPAGRWRETLPERDRAVVEAVCGREMRRFGYEPERSWRRAALVHAVGSPLDHARRARLRWVRRREALRIAAVTPAAGGEG